MHGSVLPCVVAGDPVTLSPPLFQLTPINPTSHTGTSHTGTTTQVSDTAPCLFSATGGEHQVTRVPTRTASESTFGAVSVTSMYGNMWIILAEALMSSGLLGHCFFFLEKM